MLVSDLYDVSQSGQGGRCLAGNMEDRLRMCLEGKKREWSFQNSRAVSQVRFQTRLLDSGVRHWRAVKVLEKPLPSWACERNALIPEMMIGMRGRKLEIGLNLGS